jgi:hypothetical protein
MIVEQSERLCQRADYISVEPDYLFPMLINQAKRLLHELGRGSTVPSAKLLGASSTASGL